MNIKIIIIAVTTIVTVAGIGGVIYSNTPHNNVTPATETPAVVTSETTQISVKVEDDDAARLNRCIENGVLRLGYQGISKEEIIKACKRNRGIK